MRFLNIGLLAIVAVPAFAAPPVFSVYEKVKSNTFGVWQSETGVSAVWKRFGNLSLESNLAFLERLPFRSSNVTGYTLGVTLRYRFGAKKDSFQPAVYTKTKHDLFHTYQQETGLAGSLWRQGTWSLGINAGFIYSFPLDIRHRAAGYTVGLTLSRRL